MPFYGVDHNRFKIGNIVFEALEDPDDGYRSFLRAIEIYHGDAIFYGVPIAYVKLIKIDTPNFVGYNLIDEENHCWLEVGTDYTEDYYPCFTFRYIPKKC